VSKPKLEWEDTQDGVYCRTPEGKMFAYDCTGIIGCWYVATVKFDGILPAEMNNIEFKTRDEVIAAMETWYHKQHNPKD
jgi:hypothetical protein